MRTLTLIAGSTRRVFLTSVFAVAVVLVVGAFLLSPGAGVSAAVVAVALLLILKILSELNSSFTRFESEIRSSARQVVIDTVERDAEVAHLRGEIGNIEQKLADLAASVDLENEEWKTALSGVRERAAAIENQAIALVSRVDAQDVEISGGLDRGVLISEELHALESVVQQQGQQSGVLEDSIAQAHGKTRASRHDIDTLLGLKSQQLGRRVSDKELACLITEWGEKLSLELTERSIRYMERKLVNVEASLVGRVATTTADAILRAMVARAIPEGSARVLEIGVLFGVNAAFLWEVAGVFDGQMHQTLIDPFEGYYGNDAPDPLSGLPVRRDIAVENLRRAGVPTDQYDVIVGYSGDADVIAAAAKAEYGLILVDGDHSYEGVLADHQNYFPMLARDGFMLFDDYGAETWPGVTRAVDEILGSGDVELVGVFGRTAIVRAQNREDSAE